MKKLLSERALAVLTAAAALAQVGLLLLVLGFASAVPAMAQDKRPNILLVLFDDAGFMDFGAYGSDSRTPTIDSLARSGVMLSRYHTSPMCGPSRAMLMKG